MAIEGYYKTGIQRLPAPHVQAIVHLPRIGVSGVIDFLIDTGADNTCLHPGDITKLEIPYRRMRPSTRILTSGVGGSLNYYTEPGELIFRDQDGPMRVFTCLVHICQRTPSRAIQGLPSLLGRDLLNLCSFSTNKSNNQVLLSPLNVSGNRILPPAAQPHLPNLF